MSPPGAIRPQNTGGSIGRCIGQMGAPYSPDGNILEANPHSLASAVVVKVADHLKK